jgi:hypothetical protein
VTVKLGARIPLRSTTPLPPLGIASDSGEGTLTETLIGPLMA